MINEAKKKIIGTFKNKNVSCKQVHVYREHCTVNKGHKNFKDIPRNDVTKLYTLLHQNDVKLMGSLSHSLIII